jgi:hypothetical protein
MQQITVWQANDGKIFEDEYSCRQHEAVSSAHILDPYVRAFDKDGRSMSWADDYGYVVYALLIRRPSVAEFESNLELENTWSDYVDPDLECDKNFMFGKTGWYVRDDRCDQWYRWEDYSAHFRNLADHMTDLIEEFKD